MTVETSTIKVFEVQDGEWIAGRCVDEVRGFYLQQTGLHPEEAFDDCFGQVSDAELDRLQFIYFDEPNRPSQSFASHLAELIESGQTFPCYFASGNY